MTHQFNHKGKVIDIATGNEVDSNYFKYTDADGNVHIFTIIDPITDVQQQAITLKWIYEIHSASGNIIKPRELKTFIITDEMKPGEYKRYHGIQTGAGIMGDIAFMSAINGVLEVLFNTKAFNPMAGLAPFQPVSFSLEESATNEVTATLIDGTGTIQYNIDGGSWQSSNVFSELESGEHIVGCKTTEDDYPIFEQITL